MSGKGRPHRDKVYRVTKDPNWLQAALTEAKHLFVKAADGTIFCKTHNQDATLCGVTRSGTVVYENQLDGGKYELRVVRTAPYVGKLTLTRAGGVVFSKRVGIMYDAPFGPDMEDVQTWEAMGLAAADEDYVKRGETPPTPNV